MAYGRQQQTELSPPCLGIQGHLKNGRHDSSGADGAVLIAIIGHTPTSTERGSKLTLCEETLKEVVCLKVVVGRSCMSESYCRKKLYV
ncbi:hypothetical protein AVEN_115715-1 [Araneus ventricosus]|uniref:Uncharacterized protein n=1 Tax=Araneus ventricosus TaxID=182803 RepID=A0A4Y2U9U4_ARAVE|nr:hypothetical protein AVEN_115715-1 [Araneus ventricosus]